MLRHVMAGVSGPGSARHGAVCFGRQGQARYVEARYVALLYGRSGMAGMARLGEAW